MTIRVFAEVLRDIKKSTFAKLAYVVYNSAPSLPATPVPESVLPARLARLLHNRDYREGLAWDQYQKYDQRLAKVDDPLASEDASPLLQGIPVLHVEPITSRFVHRFPEDALESLRAQELDVILRFGFNILRGGILQAAKHGVWSFHHGDNDFYRGGPAHFWELHEGNPVSGVILQVLTEKLDDGYVLAKGVFATDPGLSVARNRVQPYWGSQHFVIQKLWELHQYGPEHLTRTAIPAAPYKGKKKIYRRPSNSELLGWLGPRLIGKTIGRIKTRLNASKLVDHWRIAIRTCGIHVIDTDEKTRMDGFRWLDSPKGHAWTDPFLFERDGQYWLFFEDYLYAQKRGTLACAPLSSEGVMGEPRTILDTGSHASYPYIFSDDDAIYMIPETRALKTVRLYQAVEFPYKWEPVRDLFSGQAVDTSIWKQDGLWWFFTTLLEPRGRGAFLYLYSAETLTGKWKLHPMNPICYDVRRARGAGAIHRHGDKLLRPSQDCSKRYGYSFSLNEIVKLTPDEYEERPLVTVEPTWASGLRTTHTYNRLGRIEVTDGTKLVPIGGVA
ncbi:MAG: hypothetical protein M3Z23_19535 [Acidobacteriota bacterium]|nr:hypothetical protein [Acidobacteriota bacterium]